VFPTCLIVYKILQIKTWRKLTLPIIHIKFSIILEELGGKVSLEDSREKQRGEKPAELRYAREDILRLLREKNGSARVEDVEREVGGGDILQSALESLERDGLIRRSDSIIELTGEGARAAEEVYRRHVELEERLRDVFEDLAHQVAHFAEHAEMSPEVIEKLARGRRIVSLAELEKGRTGRLIAVVNAEPAVVARLYGVGLLPGRPIRVLAKGGGVVLVEVGVEGRVAAIDSGIASRVLVAVED
jgi:Mn-dependent DtxR family transcriptional regulator/Fe2+ transport system protein FeoA